MFAQTDAVTSVYSFAVLVERARMLQTYSPYAEVLPTNRRSETRVYGFVVLVESARMLQNIAAAGLKHTSDSISFTGTATFSGSAMYARPSANANRKA